MASSLGIAQKQNDDAGHKFRKRDVLSYIFLPKVFPRFGQLFLSGFAFFSFFMAQVYRGVRLLPDDHPSLSPANIGQYGIRDIVGEAARHLEWKRENIDQIMVFLAILAGLFLIVLQVATFVVAVAVPQATAGTFGFSTMFGTPDGDGVQDMAFILLDRVFGVEGVFNSCVSLDFEVCAGVDPQTMDFDTTNPVYKPAEFPWPFHLGLHKLFQFYSIGLLLVGVFILLYYVIVIVAETAQTGTPFGKRFNTVWAPIRLVVAFGLLIPISNGLNSAQYITLYMAKWGSNFASNGWILFDRTMQGEAKNMVQNLDMAVKPKEPDARGLIQFMTVAHTCKVYEETIVGDVPLSETEALPEDDDPDTVDCSEELKGKKIDAYVIKPGLDMDNSQQLLRGMSYDQAKQFAGNSDILIRFGDRNCRKDYAMAGNVEPTCGEITLPVNSVTEPGAEAIQSGYFNLIKYLWGGFGTGATGDIASYQNTLPATGENNTHPERNACVPDGYNPVLNSGTGSYDASIRRYALSYFQNGIGGSKKWCEKGGEGTFTQNYQPLDAPPEGWTEAAIKHYMWGSDADEDEESDLNTDVGPYTEYPGAGDSDVIIRNILKHGVISATEAVDNGDYNVSDDNRERGWAAAGIWYNKIAQMNGALVGAAWDIPAPSRFPQMMMTVLQQKRQNDSQVAPDDMFCPAEANADMQLALGPNGKDYAKGACEVYKLFQHNSMIQPTGNILADFINVLFGTQGLFDLRYEHNQRAHPLAMLVGVGKGLIEASIRNLGIGMGSGLASIVAGFVTGGAAGPELLSAVSGFFFSIATMTLTVGFILFYVIPFLPFLYFFFAVGNWLKGVFEAMVGVPLWALAHLRIDGNGLPGDAAINGYYMLFEIFLRPIVILFGFIASITIFTAMATVLHEIFEVAVDNLTGTRGSGASRAIDTFFYTVMYAVIMYMMALSSFKLIDLVPNQIMRWMGSNVSTFSDLQQNAAENLTQYTAIAGGQMAGQLSSGLQGAMSGASRGASQLGAGVQNMVGGASRAGR